MDSWTVKRTYILYTNMLYMQNIPKIYNYNFIPQF